MVSLSKNQTVSLSKESSSLRRNNGHWDFTAHGDVCRGRTIDDMHSDIISMVIRK
ncbi:stress response protein SCP2 [Klebsiella sp. BIGb0407]|nr:stress response protein SCP2 [Klebsiella sp. BIGb0407]